MQLKKQSPALSFILSIPCILVNIRTHLSWKAIVKLMKFWCIKKGMSVCLFLTPHTISLSLSFVCVAFAFFSFSTVRPYLIFNIYDIVLSAVAFSIQIPFLLIFLFLHCICGTIVVLKVFRYLLFSLCEIGAGSFCWIVRQFLFTLLFLHTNKPPWLPAKSTLPSLRKNICTIANPWRHIYATSVLFIVEMGTLKSGWLQKLSMRFEVEICHIVVYVDVD